MPYGWHDGGWGLLWMVASWALLVGIVVWIVRWSDRRPPEGSSPQAHGPDPERILEERFARGEISEQELIERRRVLRSGKDPRATPEERDR